MCIDIYAKSNTITDRGHMRANADNLKKNLNELCGLDSKPNQAWILFGYKITWFCLLAIDT